MPQRGYWLGFVSILPTVNSRPLAGRCGKAVLRAGKKIRETSAPKFMVTFKISAEEQVTGNTTYVPSQSMTQAINE
ncbi:hypothetical protein KCU95_g78, partial [Aureobasidium melanogenum]